MKDSTLRGFLSFLGWTIIIVLAVINAAKFGFAYALFAVLVILAVFVYVKRASIMYIIGQGKFNSGDKKEAFRWFEKAYATGTLKPQNSLFYAYLVLRDGQLEKSEELICDVLKKHKSKLSKNDLINMEINKALISWKKGDLKDAIKKAEKIYNDNVRTTALYGILGYWYVLDGEIQKAIKINEQAYEYNKSDDIICDNLAQNYFLLGNTEKAEKMYLDLLKKNPTFIEPYYNYGVILKSKGENEKAKEYFEKALGYEEKFLSTVTHEMVKKELESIS